MPFVCSSNEVRFARVLIRRIKELTASPSADAINAELIVFAPIFGGGPPHPSPPPIVARYLALR